MGRLAGSALALVAAPLALAAQTPCFPGKGSNEARTMAIFAVPLAFAGAGVPSASGSRLQLGLELSYLPNVDRATATPTICEPGKGPENTDLLFAVPRPRLALRLGSGFSIEGSWVPPIRINRVEANLFGLAVSWDHPVKKDVMALRLRAHGTFGRINAPITCNDAALQDAASQCYQGTRSDDRFRPNIFGGDAAFYWSVANRRVLPYFGLGYNRLMPRFQVNFTDAQGTTDNRRVEVDLDRMVVYGGLTWMASSRVGLSGEAYSAPSDALTGRVAIRVGIGR
jgi:hypothetical protein